MVFRFRIPPPPPTSSLSLHVSFLCVISMKKNRLALAESGVGGLCFEDSHCRLVNSFCQYQRCQCGDVFFPNDTMDSCQLSKPRHFFFESSSSPSWVVLCIVCCRLFETGAKDRIRAATRSHSFVKLGSE